MIIFVRQIILASLILISGSGLATQKQEIETYKFGVYPYLSPNAINDIYLPVSQKLSRVLTKKVSLLTESTHRQFLKKLNNEHYDIALIPPFWYPVAVDKRNYLPVVRMQEPFISKIMVLESSGIYSVNDLKGKVIATPPVSSPVVNLSIKSLLKQGMVPGRDFIFKDNETAEECLQKVFKKEASACISPPYAPAHFEKEMNTRLRSVNSSSGIPSASLIIHSRVNSIVRYAIRDSFISWKNTTEGRAILKRMHTKAYVPIQPHEYDVVRKLLKHSKIFH